jgi:hypothetical protein
MRGRAGRRGDMADEQDGGVGPSVGVESAPQYDVFISFARPGGLADAQALRDALLARRLAHLSG